MKYFITKIRIKLITIFSLFLVPIVSANTLSADLMKWSHDNPVVKIGVDSTFPPFDYVNEQGSTAGAGKIIDLLIKTDV